MQGESPSLILLGNVSLTIEAGNVYKDAGARAIDIAEGDISGRISVQGQVNTSVLGQYILTYHVRDAEAYEAKPIIRVITVVDTTSPVVSAPKAVRVISKHAEAMQVNLGIGVVEDLFPITIENDAPDMYPVGDTLVTWHVVDESGNQQVATQLVTVIAGETIAKK
ncbi:MAG: DUF5011 domain-containing protein [Ghiorsea sp.]